jgi:hypothetical protein
MSTVIDKLIIELGLDPSGFTKGQKQAAKALVEQEKQVKNSADNMGKAITKAARQFALAFLGFSTAAGMVKVLSGLDRMTRQLGFIAKNTNTSETELRNWANAAEVAGGSFDGLLQTVQKVNKEQYDFLQTGQNSWQGYVNALEAATGKHIAFYDVMADGSKKARNTLDLIEDISEALGTIEKTQGRAAANNLGLNMGIDQGTLNFLLMSKRDRGQLLSDQRNSQYQIKPKDSANADALERRFTMLKQQGESLLLELLSKLRPSLEKLATNLEEWMKSIDLNKLGQRIDALITVLSAVAEHLGGAFDKAGTFIGEGTAKVVEYFHKKLHPEDRSQADKLNDAIEARNGNGSFTGFDYKTGGELIDSLGLTNESQIAAMLTKIEKITRKPYDAELTEDDRRALHNADLFNSDVTPIAPRAGARNPAAMKSAQGAGARNRAANAPPIAANMGTSTSVQIDNINIHTSAQNAPSIANNIADHLRRRLLVAQADTGLA